MPLTHLLLGLDEAQVISIFMVIKATRTKIVAVFMLVLAGLNSQEMYTLNKARSTGVGVDTQWETLQKQELSTNACQLLAPFSLLYLAYL